MTISSTVRYPSAESFSAPNINGTSLAGNRLNNPILRRRLLQSPQKQFKQPQNQTWGQASLKSEDVDSLDTKVTKPIQLRNYHRPQQQLNEPQQSLIKQNKSETHHLRSPSFTIPPNVAETKFIRQGAMEATVPILTSTRVPFNTCAPRPNVRMLSSSTTQVIMQPTSIEEPDQSSNSIQPKSTDRNIAWVEGFEIEGDDKLAFDIDDDVLNDSHNSSSTGTGASEPIAEVASAMVIAAGGTKKPFQIQKKSDSIDTELNANVSNSQIYIPSEEPVRVETLKGDVAEDLHKSKIKEKDLNNEYDHEWEYEIDFVEMHANASEKSATNKDMISQRPISSISEQSQVTADLASPSIHKDVAAVANTTAGKIQSSPNAKTESQSIKNKNLDEKLDGRDNNGDVLTNDANVNELMNKTTVVLASSAAVANASAETAALTRATIASTLSTHLQYAPNHQDSIPSPNNLTSTDSSVAILSQKDSVHKREEIESDQNTEKMMKWSERIDAAETIDDIRKVELEEMKVMQEQAAEQLRIEQAAVSRARSRLAESKILHNSEEHGHESISGSDDTISTAHASMMDSIREEYKEKLQQRLQSAGFGTLANQYLKNQNKLQQQVKLHAGQLRDKLLNNE